MNIGIINIINNIGISFEYTILIIALAGGLIFYAKDFKLGVIMHFIFSGLLFMWFYSAGYNFVPPLMCFFLFLVILAFTLYNVNKVSQARGFV